MYGNMNLMKLSIVNCNFVAFINIQSHMAVELRKARHAS